MKKFILAIMCLCSINSFAQTAVQTSKVYDNVSVGITGGVSTPLNFSSITPLQTNIGIKLQKNFTPVVGMQIEGVAFLKGV